MGLDDLRLFPFYLGHPVPLLCEQHVEERIRKSFDYAFSDQLPSHRGAVPQLEFRQIQPGSFSVLGAELIAFRLQHGSFSVLGFRIGKTAYCTDTNGIPEETWPLLEGLDVLVLDALRSHPHPTHFSLEEALEVIQRVRPRRAILTHMCHDLEHEETQAQLPEGVELAYDGLRTTLT